MTTLEEVTQRILHALRDHDFEGLSAALDDRARLIASGAVPTQEAWQMGEAACQGLAALKQRLAQESTRLEQMRTVAEAPRRDPALVDYRG